MKFSLTFKLLSTFIFSCRVGLYRHHSSSLPVRSDVLPNYMYTRRPNIPYYTRSSSVVTNARLPSHFSVKITSLLYTLCSQRICKL